MKSVRIFALLFVLGTLSISCEKCYECELQLFDSDGNMLDDVNSASICSSPAEAKILKADYESSGYTCVQQ